ncbi:DUF1593 domain-containing protein, partial [Lyngbya confervoides]
GSCRATAQNDLPPRSLNPTMQPRTIVTTDGEVDDRSSFVRFLLYTTDFDVEGIIATNSVWQQDGHGTGWITDLIEKYAQIRPNLLQHDPRYPAAADLQALVMLGNEDRQRLHEVGPENDTPGSQHIIDVLLDDDPRPVWLQAWGGTNTIAQALWRLRESYSVDEVERAIAKARIYAISDQDETIWWIRDEFPEVPLVLNYQFTAINYDHQGHPYSDDPMFSPEWMRTNVKEGHGPLGAAYPQAYFSEGDSPAFFHLIDTGLRSSENLAYGGWGGRFVPSDPEHPNFWRDAQDDGDALKPLWRWLPQIQNDFAARMDWAIGDYAAVNHPPAPVIAGELDRTVRSGDAINLDAAETSDPDGDNLTYQWWIYAEAGSYPDPIALQNADRPQASFTAPEVQEPETVHVILEVTDQGEPALTRYQRAIVTIQP